jgi:hypothetical protein
MASAIRIRELKPEQEFLESDRFGVAGGQDLKRRDGI